MICLDVSGKSSNFALSKSKIEVHKYGVQSLFAKKQTNSEYRNPKKMKEETKLFLVFAACAIVLTVMAILLQVFVGG